jgi:predicted PurR-regulated permease PerM
MFGCEAIADNRILVSVIVGVTNVIPFFGPYIGGIPSVVLILCVKPVDGLIFAIFIIALQQFDCNYLDPRIVGRSVGLSPLYVLVFCLIGGGLFGIVGMLIGSPTGAVIYGLAKSWTESRLEQKNLPTQTIDYVNTPGAIIYGNSVNKDEKNN